MEGALTAVNSSLDCPVPRLTLLFFGATKDVPEEAKMVTAGTARLHFERPNVAVRQAALRPLRKCATREITAIISRR